MRYVIGIDLGTSGAKTVLFDESGAVISSYTGEYPLIQPRNGWAEQRPEDWWRAVRDGIREVFRVSGISPEYVKGVGLSGQMHGLVMLDKNNRVIRNAIIWCDQRTAAECADMNLLAGNDRILKITANPAMTGFTASKILWIKKHEPENYKMCAHILLPKDYIRFMLTGVYATDVSDASGTQLLDIAGRCWSDEILARFEIERGLLPDVYESPDITGYVTEQASEATGLTPDTIVAGGAGDNAAAAVGTGTVNEGEAFTTIGTSGVVYAHTKNMVFDGKGRIHTFCCAVPGEWHVMGVTQSAGLSLQWLKRTVCRSECEAAEEAGVDPYVIMDGEAEKSPVGSNRLLFLPYFMGERTPHLDPNARGVFFGLSAMHTRGDMIRAVMEGVAFSLYDCLNVLFETGIGIGKMLICGGGGSSPLWRRMLCDIFNMRNFVPASKEGAALGAAVLAMTAAGIYPSVKEACGAVTDSKNPLSPVAETHERYMPYYKLYGGLYRSLKSSFTALAEI